jgi:ribonuclease J
MAQATGRKTIPKPGNKYNGIEVKVFIPKNQRIAILREKAFNKLEWVNSSRIYDNTFGFKEHQNEMVMLYRNSSAFEFEKADCLEEATLIWSLWSGYLRDDPFIWDFIKRHSIKLHQVHCSGHAYVEDIKKLAKALYPCKIVPIHTQAPEAFKQLFGPDVELHLDEEWWRV